VWTRPCRGVPVHLACEVWIPRLYRRHAHISAATVGWWPTAHFLAAWARPQALRHVLEGHCSPLAVASTGRGPPVGSRRVAAPPCLSFRGGRAAHARRINSVHRPARGVNSWFSRSRGPPEGKSSTSYRRPRVHATLDARSRWINLLTSRPSHGLCRVRACLKSWEGGRWSVIPGDELGVVGVSVGGGQGEQPGAVLATAIRSCVGSGAKGAMRRVAIRAAA
jgi:hypothetical protein